MLFKESLINNKGLRIKMSDFEMHRMHISTGQDFSLGCSYCNRGMQNNQQGKRYAASEFEEVVQRNYASLSSSGYANQEQTQAYKSQDQESPEEDWKNAYKKAA